VHTIDGVASRPISSRELNRTLLVRQSLVRRSGASLPGVLHRVAGLQTQYAPAGYVGLWSRSELRDRETLTTALERRSVVQATLVRATIHMVSAHDFPIWLAAIRRWRREWWTKLSEHESRSDRDVTGAVALVSDALADGPRRRRELEALLAEAGHPEGIWGAVELWLDMVRVPPSGTWDRRRADLYGRADLWTDMPATEPRQATASLFEQYLGAYGPSTIESASTWTGVPKAALTEALESRPLRAFESDTGEHLVDLPRRPIADAGLEVPVRFLPTWDDILLVHARRAGVLREEHRHLIFNTKMPHSVGTFLVDGVVAGTWRPSADGVTVEPFDPIPRRWRRELEEERRALTAFHARRGSSTGGR